MKVKVSDVYQVVHDGNVYVNGDTFEAPKSEAEMWLAAGYVEEVKASPTKAAASKK